MLQERILIVEDEPDLTPAFVDILTSVGFDTSTTSDGEVAIQMLGDNNNDISDRFIPAKSGRFSGPRPPVAREFLHRCYRNDGPCLDRISR
jgi:CheY-like chemotaxis protein